MNETEARARLERMTDAYSDPALTEEDIYDCVMMSRLVDANGLAPSDPDWTPTWDLNRGAAEGWRRKKGKIAMHYDFSSDGQSFSRSQAVQHCEEMIRHYQRRIATSIRVPGTLAREDD